MGIVITTVPKAVPGLSSMLKNPKTQAKRRLFLHVLAVWASRGHHIGLGFRV